jgi:hypothetical protein
MTAKFPIYPLSHGTWWQETLQTRMHRHHNNNQVPHISTEPRNMKARETAKKEVPSSQLQPSSPYIQLATENEGKRQTADKNAPSSQLQPSSPYMHRATENEGKRQTADKNTPSSQLQPSSPHSTEPRNTEHFRRCQLRSHWRTSQHFTEPRDSWLSSQQPLVPFPNQMNPVNTSPPHDSCDPSQYCPHNYVYGKVLGLTSRQRGSTDGYGATLQAGRSRVRDPQIKLSYIA